MTDKAYIVANKEQELDVLNKFEEKGLIWLGGEKSTEWLPSESGALVSFPYSLIEKEKIEWSPMTRFSNKAIVYDGRKEEKMYKVTQEFMNALIEWRDDNNLDTKTGLVDTFIDGRDINNIPNILDTWWTDSDNPIENNSRLIAIIKWLNGEDVFEVEEPHKFVVRTKLTDKFGDYNYVKVFDCMAILTFLERATKFDTREEAQEWANSHQVVVEIDEEGNEVE